MRYVTSNPTPLSWPKYIGHPITPHAATHPTCWVKRRCKGSGLPPERQPGGVCAECAALLKAKSEIAAASFSRSSRKRGEVVAQRKPFSGGFKPLSQTAKANKAERSVSRWRDPAKEFKPTIPDDKVPMTSGTLRRLSDTLHVPMLWGARPTVRAAYLVECARDLGGCGRGPFHVARGKLARTHQRLSACEGCIQEVHRRNEKKQKRALYERRKAERLSQQQKVAA